MLFNIVATSACQASRGSGDHTGDGLRSMGSGEVQALRLHSSRSPEPLNEAPSLDDLGNNQFSSTFN
jgi:hypothetical protein